MSEEKAVAVEYLGSLGQPISGGGFEDWKRGVVHEVPESIARQFVGRGHFKYVETKKTKSKVEKAETVMEGGNDVGTTGN